MDKVSIIVPVYNVEQYLSRCIEALLNQSYRNIEIILIDDKSKDKSKDIIEKYAQKDCRVFPLYQIENMGVSAARNKAIKNATGEWICFCDGDDWFEPNFVEKMLACGAYENADYIICNYKIVSEHGPAVISGSIDGISSGCDLKKVIACGPTSSCTHMIKKKLFEISDVCYPEGCRQYEELPVIPVLAKYASKIGVVEEPLYNYYQRGDGTSASNAAKDSEKNFFTAWDIMKNKLGEEYNYESEYYAIYSLFYGEILYLCKRKEKKDVIIEKIAFYESIVPDYLKNPYINQMGKAKRFFVWMVSKKFITGLRVLSWIHGKIVG